MLSLTKFRHPVGVFAEAEVGPWTIGRDDVSKQKRNRMN